jgi:hypothetical protein
MMSEERMSGDLAITMSMAEQIQKRIDEIVADSKARLAYTAGANFYKIAATQNALPIFSDMSGYIAIRPDGSFVFWGGEGTDFENEIEPVFQAIALISGSREYPELQELIPKRTDDAKPCLDCKGTGKAFILDIHSHVFICGKCLGLGWINQEIVSLSANLTSVLERQADA